MEIEVTIENRKGEVFTVKVKKPKPLAIPLFFAKLSRYANKNHKITSVYCDDIKFLGQIMGFLPPKCETTMIREI